MGHSNEAERTLIARKADAVLAVHISGSGPAVMMFPALGRGVADFDALTRRLVAAGFMVVRADPRGIAGSSGNMDGLSLDILAEDARLALATAGIVRAVLLGHAFGGRIARRLAELHPDRVQGLILLATGGKTPMAPGVDIPLWQSYDLTLPEDQRMAAVHKAFFAPGGDPMAWRDGWWPGVIKAQLAASGRPGIDTWWRGGGKPMLVLQGMDDQLGPPQNAAILKADLGDQVTVVEVPHAGHAMLPEQPEKVATEVLKFVRRLNGG